MTHVATHRLLGEPPRGLAARAAFFARSQWEAIGLPFDGQRLVDGSLGELAARVEALMALGYRVPGDLIARIEVERKTEGIER